jgi:hypothetical protein
LARISSCWTTPEHWLLVDPSSSGAAKDPAKDATPSAHDARFARAL